jgi:hypothetical protein
MAFFWWLLRFMKELVEVKEIFFISKTERETKGQLLNGEVELFTFYSVPFKSLSVKYGK